MVLQTADEGEIALARRVCSAPWPPVARKVAGQTAEKGMGEKRNERTSSVRLTGL
jgi:hypothetical protein